MKKAILTLLACLLLLGIAVLPAAADSSPLGSVPGVKLPPLPVPGTGGSGPAASGVKGGSVSGIGSATTAAVAAASFVPVIATAGSGHTAKAPIEKGNAFCGFDFPTLPVIGFTTYNRPGPTTVSFEYHLKNAVPNSTYNVQLWGDFCTFFGSIGTVTTNGEGVANGNGSVTVPATSTRFFATSFGPIATGVNSFSDTPAVILAP